MSNLDNILNSLKGVKKVKANNYKALCPVHSEQTPSLSITSLPDDRIIMHCFGCGANGVDVIKSLGLEVEDLFPEKIQNERVGYKAERQPFSANDILKLLLHEVTVVSIAAQMIGNGERLSTSDIVRVEQARHRIDEAVLYVNR